MKIRTFVPLVALVLSLVGTPPAPATAQQALTYEQARTAMDAAEAEARRNGWNLTILIADADGVPIYLRRLAGASARTYEIATAKVRTALAARMATGDYGQALAAGRADSIPNGITFTVSVRDNAGNRIVRFGGYGNYDCQGPASAEPIPAIPLGWPVAAGASDRHIYVRDCLNHRVVRVDKTFAVEAEAAVPQGGL